MPVDDPTSKPCEVTEKAWYMVVYACQGHIGLVTWGPLGNHAYPFTTACGGLGGSGAPPPQPSPAFLRPSPEGRRHRGDDFLAPHPPTTITCQPTAEQAGVRPSVGLFLGIDMDALIPFSQTVSHGDAEPLDSSFPPLGSGWLRRRMGTHNWNCGSAVSCNPLP